MWGFPVAKYLWSALKGLGGAVAKVFRWAWKVPDTALVVGLGFVAFSWLAKSWGWADVASWANAFGWTIVGVAATSAAVPGWNTVTEAAGSWWASVQELFSFGYIPIP